MTELVSLGPLEQRLLDDRFGEHGNSHRRMASALEESGAGECVARLHALRRIERRFQVDLGSLCYRYRRKDEDGIHPLERLVLGFVAFPQAADGGERLVVRLDRIRAVRDLVDGKLEVC